MDKITKKAPHHLGMPGINSPGYAPREGTDAKAEADAWMKEYWAKLSKARNDKTNE